MTDDLQDLRQRLDNMEQHLQKMRARDARRAQRDALDEHRKTGKATLAVRLPTTTNHEDADRKSFVADLIDFATWSRKAKDVEVGSAATNIVDRILLARKNHMQAVCEKLERDLMESLTKDMLRPTTIGRLVREAGAALRRGAQ